MTEQPQTRREARLSRRASSKLLTCSACLLASCFLLASKTYLLVTVCPAKLYRVCQNGRHRRNSMLSSRAPRLRVPTSPHLLDLGVRNAGQHLMAVVTINLFLVPRTCLREMTMTVRAATQVRSISNVRRRKSPAARMEKAVHHDPRRRTGGNELGEHTVMVRPLLNMHLTKRSKRFTCGRESGLRRRPLRYWCSTLTRRRRTL